MAYIGASIENRVSPQFLKEDFTGTGSTTTFTLTNEVPGGSSQNVMVVVNNVVQEPDVAYTISYCCVLILLLLLDIFFGFCFL